jgi:hypothetical protein
MGLGFINWAQKIARIAPKHGTVFHVLTGSPKNPLYWRIDIKILEKHHFSPGAISHLMLGRIVPQMENVAPFLLRQRLLR